MKRGLCARGLVFVAGAAAFAGLVAPGSAQAAAQPDLKVTIAVTPVKDTYAVGDVVTTTFTITNIGTATAVNARLDGGDEEGLTRAGDFPADHADLAPGQSLTFAWAGTVNPTALVDAAAHGGWSVADDNGDADPTNNAGHYRIAVPGLTGSLALKVFVDRTGDFDSNQPGLARAALTVTDAKGVRVASATTDALGKAFFAELLPGDYQVLVAGWKVEGESGGVAHVEVKGGQAASALLAVLPRAASASPSPSASTTKPTKPAPTGSASPTAATTTPSASPSPVALPVTGSRSGPLFLVGLAVLIAGTLTFLISRRRRFILPE